MSPQTVAVSARAVAASLPIEGTKRRRVIERLAELHDAGEPMPTPDELGEDFGWDPRRVRSLLVVLRDAGYLTLSPKERRPRLRFLEPQPVAGATFKHAARLPIDGTKRRKVLLLIAAYLDAGAPDPSCAMLGRRVGLPSQVVATLVDRLEADGFLSVERATEKREGFRNRYAIPDGGR